MLILLITPILWSLPTSLMIGELASSMPEEGGYYAWVRRAMGDMWGFQEAWLSLAASIFDMAIYPTLFVTYLTKLFPSPRIQRNRRTPRARRRRARHRTSANRSCRGCGISSNRNKFGRWSL